MPITTDEKVALDDALANMDSLDSVHVARLLYDVLLHAKVSKENPNGMGFKACTSLGRLVKDKAAWDQIQSVEKVIEAAIRLPLIQSTDIVFKARLATSVPKLAEEHKQTIAHVFGKMDGNELVSLTRAIYETIVHTQFASPEAQDTFGRLYYTGYSWNELSRSPDIMKGVLFPIVDSVHGYLREAIANVFAIEEPAPLPQEPPVTTEAQQELPVPAPEQHALPRPESSAEDDDTDGHHPTDPMPLPEFASAEEIQAREKRDAEKPAFKDGKKKKNKQKNGALHEFGSESDSPDTSAELQEESQENDGAEPPHPKNDESEAQEAPQPGEST